MQTYQYPVEIRVAYPVYFFTEPSPVPEIPSQPKKRPGGPGLANSAVFWTGNISSLKLHGVFKCYFFYVSFTIYFTMGFPLNLSNTKDETAWGLLSCLLNLTIDQLTL